MNRTSDRARAADSRPLVSIVMPTYNRARYILDAVESIQRQTYDNWCLHLIDDGSTDATRAVLHDALGDPRIRYEYQSNAGQSAARNRGIRACEGTYVSFLDSDNIWERDKLEIQVKLAEDRSDFDVFFGDTAVIDENGALVPSAGMRRSSGRVTERLLTGNFVTFNTSFVRRTALLRVGGFNETFRSGEDFDLWLRLSVHSSFYYSARVLARYRITPGSISSDVWKNLSANQQILSKFIADHRDQLPLGAIDAAWSKFYVRCGRAYASQKRRRAALHEYLRALRHEPTAPHAWRAIVALALKGR